MVLCRKYVEFIMQIHSNLGCYIQVKQKTYFQIQSIILHFLSSTQGPNALVTYTIISGADDSFRIDPESGDLIATKKLDRERRSKYSLLVRADDGKQSSDMRLNITVKDVNDHTPKFSRATYSFDIPEDMAPGKVFVSLSEASNCKLKDAKKHRV